MRSGTLHYPHWLHEKPSNDYWMQYRNHHQLLLLLNSSYCYLFICEVLNDYMCVFSDSENLNPANRCLYKFNIS
ncbi:hypothetical protein evm_011116 [Chilo suppressalis]|nr:hypothetical protein evm_011116 [Chilo suppressalis]